VCVALHHSMMHSVCENQSRLILGRWPPNSGSQGSMRLSSAWRQAVLSLQLTLHFLSQDVVGLLDAILGCA
jgi:hypothetical protein